MLNILQKNLIVKIIPDNIDKITVGVVLSADKNGFVASVEDFKDIDSIEKPEILISSEDYIIKFQSSIERIERNKIFFSFITRPVYIQKREYPRVEANLPVKLFDKAKNINYDATICNLGGGGMQLKLANTKNISPNTLLQASFDIPSKKDISAVFRVLRVQQDNPIILVSGNFTEISTLHKTAIIQFCFKRKLELKLKNN